MRFDKDKIIKLSSEIFNASEKLNELSLLSREDFLSDSHKVASAKYFLIVSIEAAIDMCNHLISKNRLRVGSRRRSYIRDPPGRYSGHQGICRYVHGIYFEKYQ